MRTTLAITALLALTFLAGVAQAADDCTPLGAGDGTARVSFTDCKVSVVVFDDLVCAGAWSKSVGTTVAGHSATMYYCFGATPTPVLHQPGASACKLAGCPVQIEQVGSCIGAATKMHDPTLGPLDVKVQACDPSESVLPPL